MSVQSSISRMGRLWGLFRQNPLIAPSFLRYEYRRRWGAELDRRRHPEKSALPAYISLNPTRRCNLACRMCVQYRREEASRPDNLSWYDARQELPLSAWINLLDQLVAWRPVIFITGGEPLLYPHLRDLLAAAKQRHLLVHLQTNGVLLHRLAQDLVELGVEMVTVSLDGPQEIHDEIRGRGMFHRSSQGFQTLVAAREDRGSPGPLVDLRCTISKDNLDHLPELVPVALDLGADMLHFTHTIFLTRALAAQHNRSLSAEFAQEQGLTLIPPSIPDGEFYQSDIGPADLPRLAASLAEVKRRAQGLLEVGFSPNLPEVSLGPYYLDLSHPFPQVCQHLWKTCRILPDGTVSPCLHLVMGNITEIPLAEIWNNAPYRNLRRLAAQRLFPGCARCCHRKFN